MVAPAFDTRQPPSLDLIEDCVHCGFCLPSCPTYVLWGEEMDSPRGRIHLMREGLEGEPLTEAMVGHFDACLGCLACVTACPSGVKYGDLIEATRGQIERRYSRERADALFRAVFYRLFPYPARLNALLPLLRLYHGLGMNRILSTPLGDRLPGRVRALAEMAPATPAVKVEIPEWTPAAGEERGRVGLLLGCVQQAFFSDVHAATVRVLAAEGYGVVAPASQGCCGALSEHAGRRDEARRFARGIVDTFESAGVDFIAVNVAGCGSAMKEYAALLSEDRRYAERASRLASRVHDVTELLARGGSRAPRHPLPLSVVYHDPCHLAHGQGVRLQPRALLLEIPGLEVREVPRERDICCGSAGTYNLLQPEAGRDLGDRKARAVLDAGAQLLVTANPGCDLQITAAGRRLHQSIPAAHIIQVLDASIRGISPDELLRPSSASGATSSVGDR
jgi:glycolate oxidase iron-sulfur subunit